MDKERQRIVIAENNEWRGPFIHHHWNQFLGFKDIDGAIHRRVPDYLGSLDAISEAVNSLKDTALEIVYIDNLEKIMKPRDNAFASAAQCA